ncbi:unnamed protein product, partial [Rotaria sp. Silwood2]
NTANGVPTAPPLATFLQQTINDLQRDKTNLTRQVEQLTQANNTLQAESLRINGQYEQLRHDHEELKKNFHILLLKVKILEESKQEPKDGGGKGDDNGTGVGGIRS